MQHRFLSHPLAGLVPLSGPWTPLEPTPSPLHVCLPNVCVCVCGGGGGGGAVNTKAIMRIK